MERDLPWPKTPKETILPRNGWKCRLIELTAARFPCPVL